MSLVENIISQISNNELGGITKPQGFDFNDNTFEKMLQDKVNSINKIPEAPKLGAPAGLIIESIDAPKSIAEIQPINTDAVEIKDIDTNDFFTNIIKTHKSGDNGIFDLAKKHAANAYSTFAGKYVTDLKDFISDTMAALS